MGQIENKYAFQFIANHTDSACGLYEEALRSPEADLQPPLVSKFLGRSAKVGFEYAKKRVG